jgi:hypothetical protein
MTDKLEAALQAAIENVDANGTRGYATYLAAQCLTVVWQATSPEVSEWETLRKDAGVVIRRLTAWRTEIDHLVGFAGEVVDAIETQREIARLTQKVLDLEAQLEREESPVPPESLICHNPSCFRRYSTMERLRDALISDPDPFYWSEDLDSWICPDCGGTNVY